MGGSGDAATRAPQHYHCIYAHVHLGYSRSHLAHVLNKSERTIGNWLHTYNETGCPHASCAHLLDVNLHHVFWTCPAAKQLRSIFTATWIRLGISETALETACFGLGLLDVPPALWELVTRHQTIRGERNAMVSEYITALVEGCWQLGAALYFHAVWRWRVQHFDDTNDVTGPRHHLLLAKRLRQGYSTIHLYVQPHGGSRAFSAVAAIVAAALRQPWNGSHQVVPAANQTCRFLLFFDGGSRGNPGPGGSGAVVVRLTLDGCPFQLVWAGSMSYAARTTTNNVAENLGLLAGLSACNRYGFSPLHVVGSSGNTRIGDRPKRPISTHSTGTAAAK